MTTAASAARHHDHRIRPRGPSPVPLGRARLRPVREPDVPLTDSIGVLASTMFQGEATAAWIRSIGHSAELVDARGWRMRATMPRVLLAHGADALAGLPLPTLQRMQVIVLVDPANAASLATVGSAAVVGGARVIRNSPDAGAELRTTLAQILGAPAADRVTLSRREQEVLATYVLGETVKETAAHHFIAECTVRTHYRRVTKRYEEAGRPIANKAQLLLAMVSDGWLRLDGSLGPRADE